MKSHILLSLFLLCLLSQSVTAQKHDYNWLIGYGDFTITEPNRHGLILDFNAEEVSATIFEKEQDLFLTILTYSDADGQLQLYSDGCAFYNENGDLLQNGNQIHDDNIFFCDGDPTSGYPADQGMIALPTTDKDIVAVFYNEEYIVDDSLGVRIEVRLLRAFIDTAQDIVLSKNETILDTLVGNTLSATKHTNGQDWWILGQDYFTNEYKSLLISEGEVLDTVSSFVGNPVINPGSFQSNFSPDGKRFARFSVSDDLQVFDFDRSTGLLSNPRFVDVPTQKENNANFGGLAFSGSSRFLYVNDAWEIWQLDLQEENINESMLSVARRDTFFTGQDVFNDAIPTFFYRQALAPDCRIYMSASNGVDRIYVIMEPEQKGEACHVVQNIKIPVWNSRTTPHFPNYRLDTAPFCDSSKAFPSNLMTTVSTSSLTQDIPQRLHLFPNPAADEVQLYLKHFSNLSSARIVLYDLLGRAVLSRQLILSAGAALEPLDISTLAAGMYAYSVNDEAGVLLGSDRLVVE